MPTERRAPNSLRASHATKHQRLVLPVPRRIMETKKHEGSVLSRLAGRPIVHHALRVLRLQAIARAALSLRPISRRLPGTGLEYRVRHLESLLLSDEMFNRRVYDDAFAGIEVSTFIDLGSNVGYFPVFAAQYTGRRDLIGLLVDADEGMAKESSWHVTKNRLTRTTVVRGLVGYPSDQRSATFYVNASNVASSAQPVENPNVPSKGKTRKVTVPTIELLAEWRKAAGDSRIDLLKIDVEGFEVQVLGTIGPVLDLTDSIVIEWHRWVTSKEEIEEILLARGFRLTKVVHEDVHAGVGVFRRKQD